MSPLRVCLLGRQVFCLGEACENALVVHFEPDSTVVTAAEVRLVTAPRVPRPSASASASVPALFLLTSLPLTPLYPALDPTPTHYPSLSLATAAH